MQPIRIKQWELSLVTKITSHFVNTDKDELQAELYKKLLELKHKKIKADNWKNFLAKSLFNAANDYLRKHKHYYEHNTPLENDNDEKVSLLDTLPEQHKTENIELKLTLEKLSPQMRKLWDILMEEEANITNTAKRLGKPRTTINYWLKKLKEELEKL